MRILVYLIIAILLILPAYSIKECGRFTKVSDIPCNIITSYHPTGNCNSYNISIYNSTNVKISNKAFIEYSPYCRAVFNNSKTQTYLWNSSIESGVIVVEGDESEMILILGIFILLINLALAYIPFIVKFGKSKAQDYIIKRLLWISAILLLWFNMTMFRQLSSNWGLGLDEFLVAYWWMFTLGAFSCVLIICYVMVVGATKIMEEAKMKRRLGDSDNE